MSTFNDVHSALRQRAARTSASEANRVMARVAGTNKLSEVDPEKYREIIVALESEEEAPENGELDARSIYAKWNSHRRAPRKEDAS
jgi:hypothetical protein